MTRKIYIKVLLPLRLEWEPCYWSDRPLHIGKRVEVTCVGKSYIGVVCKILDEPEIDPDKILEVSRYETGLDDILEEELALWKWISGYYLCSLGEVYKNAYPIVKLKGEQLQLSKLSMIEERLEKKKAAIGKHNPGTKAEAALEESIRKLEVQRIGLIEAIEGSRIDPTKRTESGYTPVVKAKPELLDGPDRIETYLERIREEMKNGRTTLLLVPEIERSRRIQNALMEEFGNDLLVFHSELANEKKREVTAKLRNGGPYVVLGTRFALFLPLTRLGLIIIDEEQDSTYKQSELAPCFNGRDTAIALASIAGANVLLGSTFPSLETVLNIRTGKYVPIGKNSTKEAQVEVIDTVEERRKHGMAGPLSFRLINELRAVEGVGRAVILASTWAQEEVSSKIAELFPSKEWITVANLYTSKWLEIPDTKLVAVISIDSMLSRQDIRADERTLQMMEMFRAKTDGGKFIVQTARSAHPVFSFGDGRAERLLSERKDFGLPPYSRLVDVSVKDSNEARKALMEKELARKLTGPWKRMQLPDTLRLILPKDRNLAASKESIRSAVLAFEKERRYQGHIHIDVDPA